MEFTNSQQWSSLQKIAFRFFFVFLSLQVLTEGFLGVLFRDDNFKIWNSIAEKFTQPCLWLNDHFFHYKYIPQSWSTYSGSLHTIRDIVYLFTAVLACAAWSIVDKKRHGYNKLYYWFSRCLIIMLSPAIFFYGIVKLFPVQMAAPSFIDMQKQLGDLSPFQLAWATFGYGQPFQVFTGFFELAGAIMILFRRSRVAGLLIIATVMMNVIMIDYAFIVGNVMITAFYMLLISCFLLAPSAFQLFRFFFTQQSTVLIHDGYIPRKNFKTKLFTIITVFFLGSTFTSNIQYAYKVYKRREGISRSSQCSFVKNFIAVSDTLKPIENNALRWRSWFERVREGKRLVTINTMSPGTDKTYLIERDSLRLALVLHPLNQQDTVSLYFNYKDIDGMNWCLEGSIHKKNTKIELQRVNPDTIMNLLKIKPMVIIFDDFSDSE